MRFLAGLLRCSGLALGTAPAGAQKAPEVPEEPEAPQFFVVSAEALAMIQALIEAQQREIERLRKVKSTEECS